MTQDPLDISRTDRPGNEATLLGASPDFWHNLANFGLSTIVAANARNPNGFLTYGQGSAGPVAAGLLAAQQQNMGEAEGRSTQAGRDIETRTKTLMLPYQLQLAGLNADINKALLKEVNSPDGTESPAAPSEPSGGFGQTGRLAPTAPATPGQGPPASRSDSAGGTLPTGTPPAGGRTFAAGIAGSESGGERNPDTATNSLWPAERGGPLGRHQFAARTWDDFVRDNPTYFAGMTPQQAQAARADPALSERATNWYATQNAPILARAGMPVTNQTLALAHTLGPADAVAALQAPPTMNLIDALAVRNPGHAAAVAAANPTYRNMTVGQFAQRYAAFNGLAPVAGIAYTPQGPGATAGGPPPSAVAGPGAPAPPGPQLAATAPPGGGPTAPGGSPAPAAPAAPAGSPAPAAPAAPAGSPAPAAPAGAPAPAAAPAVAPAPGQPTGNAAYVAEIQQQIAAATARARKNNLMATLLQGSGRDGSSFATQAAKDAELANALREKLYSQTPVREGQQVFSGKGHVLSSTPSRVTSINRQTNEPGTELRNPDGSLVPNSFVPAGLPKAYEVLADNASKKYEEMSKSFNLGMGGLQSLEGMEIGLRSLSADNGFLAPGAFDSARGAIANSLNTVFRQFGFNELFDPSKVATWQDLQKETSRLGFQFVSSFLGQQREAAQTIERGISAVPGTHNTPEGAILVINGVRETIKRGLDEYAYMTKWIQDPSHKGNFVGADVAFAAARPPEAYADRAISQVHPFTVKPDTDLSRYLPGTLVTPLDAEGRPMLNPNTGKPVVRAVSGEVDMWRSNRAPVGR